jgi:hypothetical protein
MRHANAGSFWGLSQRTVQKIRLLSSRGVPEYNNSRIAEWIFVKFYKKSLRKVYDLYVFFFYVSRTTVTSGVFVCEPIRVSAKCVSDGFIEKN